MKQTYSIFSSKIVLAAIYIALQAAIASPTLSVYATSTFPIPEGQTLEDSSTQELLLADDDDDDDDDRSIKKKVESDLPESVKAAVWQDISQRTNVEMSTLRVVKAEKITWPDGCLGLKLGRRCKKSLVPGWQLVVASANQMWVYRTDVSGKVAKFDEESTQVITTLIMRAQSSTQQTSRRITSEQRETFTVQSNTQVNRSRSAITQRSTQVSAATVALKSNQRGFTLAIWHPSGNISEVITRISVKTKRGTGYLKERFLGDYKYQVKQKAKFVNGLKAGDRVVVRLFDTQNRFLGYSEFECLSAHTAVNLVLPANPTEYQVVRTVYGLDTDLDGSIDVNAKTYDYFTQVSDQRVTFLSNSQQINLSQFQVEELSRVSTSSSYPVSLTTGEFAVTRQSLNVATSNLAAALRATPGQLVQVIDVDNTSAYDLLQAMRDYRQVGVSGDVVVEFSDVSTTHWARDFIAELAVLDIIEGFPDSTFRPDAQVTRAQFAAMISRAFEKARVRNAISFRDVSTRYWAYNAIREAYQMGFFGTSNRQFKPTANLSRLEVLLALAQGLNYTPKNSADTILTAYSDAATIRSDVRWAIAALTERGVIVNYPDVQVLNPDKVATRAEVCALLYKTLASTGDVVDIDSDYDVTALEQEINRRAEIDHDD